MFKPLRTPLNSFRADEDEDSSEVDIPSVAPRRSWRWASIRESTTTRNPIDSEPISAHHAAVFSQDPSIVLKMIFEPQHRMGLEFDLSHTLLQLLAYEYTMRAIKPYLIVDFGG